MRMIAGLIICVFLLSGCLVRTYTVRKPRQYTEVSGNQGYLSGEPSGEPQAKESHLTDTRPVTIFEVETGPHQTADKASTAPAKRASGAVPTYRLRESLDVEQDAGHVELSEIDIDAEIAQDEGVVERIELGNLDEPAQDYQVYTVQKNDTLQRISQKFYGTTRKWQIIYEENKSVIKNPDKVYPGMKIQIPVLK